MLIILQHSGFENAQLVQLLLYAALKLLQMLFDWFCELLCLAATQCHADMRCQCCMGVECDALYSGRNAVTFQRKIMPIS